MVNRLERLAASTGKTEGKGRRRRVQRAEPSLDLCCTRSILFFDPYRLFELRVSCHVTHHDLVMAAYSITSRDVSQNRGPHNGSSPFFSFERIAIAGAQERAYRPLYAAAGFARMQRAQCATGLCCGTGRNNARQHMLTRVRSRNHDCAETKPFTVLRMARGLRSWTM
jgi:hypothetical protein